MTYTKARYAPSMLRAIVANGRSHLHIDAPDMGDAIETRAAVVPASTTTTTALLQTALVDTVDILGPDSAFGSLISLALQLTFGSNAAIFIPALTGSASGVGYFGEGNPLQIKQYALSGATLVPQKLGFGLSVSRELFVHSNAETLLKKLMQENLSLGVDQLAFDSTAGTTIRPAGMRAGVAAIPATALSATVGQFDAMVKDLTNLAVAISPVAGSNIAFVASAGEAAKIRIRQPFFPYPVFASNGLIAGDVIAIALPALAVIAGLPKFSTSREAVVHMEDANPLPFSTVGSPPLIAAPQISLWQQDCVAIKVIFDLVWQLRRTGAIAWTTAVTW